MGDLYINNKVIQNNQNKESDKVTLQGLGQQLTQEKIKSMQKDFVINQLGQEVTKLKIKAIGGM